MKTKKTPSKKPVAKGQKPRRLAPVPGSVNELPSTVAAALEHRNRRIHHPRKTAQLCVIIDAISAEEIATTLEIMAEKMRESDPLNMRGGICGWCVSCSWAAHGEENQEAIDHMVKLIEADSQNDLRQATASKTH